MEEIRKDTEIQLIEKQVPDIIQKATALQVTTELESKYANDLAAACKKAIDKVEDRRKFFVKPLNNHIKSINEEFKKITEPLTETLNILKGKMLIYCQGVREKEEKDIKERTEIVNGLLGDETPIPEPIKTQVRSSLGMAHTKKVWTWEITDETKIPREFLMIDEKKINAIVRTNTKIIKGQSINATVIQGIRVFQKDEIAIRS